MSTRFAIAITLLVSLSLLAGCEGQPAQTPTTTIAPPPPAEGAPPAMASVDDSGTSTSGGTTVRGETLDSFNPGGNGATSSATVAPPDALAPYAAALAIVQPEHFAVLKFDMAKMRDAALLKTMPLEAEQLAKQMPVPGGPAGAAGDMAKNLEQVEMLWVSLGPPLKAEGMPMSVNVYARCTTPEAATAALAAVQLDSTQAERREHQGIAYFKSPQPDGPFWSVRGSEVLLSTDEPALHAALTAGGKLADAELLKKLATAKLDAPLVVAGSFGPFKMTLTQSAIDAINQAPIPLSPELGKLPSQITWGVVAIDPDAEAMIDIDADLDGEQSAENFKTSLEGLVSLAKIAIDQQAAAAAQAGVDDAETKQGLSFVKAALSAVNVNRDGVHVDASFNRFAELADLPAMVAMQLERARGVQALNTARMLGLAAHMYRQSNRYWPDDVKGDDGTVILSWRYLLLPYLENSALFDQISREQAWDGATNQQFAAQMPEAFASPSASEPNTTTWKMLQGHPSDIQFFDAGKGTETPWLKPDAFTIDPLNPQLSLGDEPAGGYIVVNRDGSVERLNRAALVAKLSGKPVSEEPPTAEGPPAAEEPVVGEPAVPDPLADQEPRTWTSGRSKIKAVLLGVEGDKVKLKRVDTQREFKVPLEKLSEEDQAYVRSLNLGM